MSRSAQLSRAAALVGIAVVGGVVALGGAALTGELGGDATTTVIQTAAADSRPAAVRQALSVAEIYDRAAPGVVQITSTTAQPDDVSAFPATQDPPPVQQALGSGFVIDKTGHIVTNYHVIEGADRIEVSFSNQDTLTAKVVGSDPSTDIAVLRVETSSRSLTPLDFGDSGDVRVGDTVVAIGNPFGLARSASAGIVSAVQERTITAPNGYPIDHVIQTDAAINSGNSGGPLLSDKGEVIGVNSQISTAAGSRGNVGIGFAVPSNTVTNVAAQLIDKGKVDRAFMGVGGTSIDPELAQRFRLPVDTGVLVERVGAARRLTRRRARRHGDVIVAGQSYRFGGDVIVAVDGHRVASLEELRDGSRPQARREAVELAIYRGTKRLTDRRHARPAAGRTVRLAAAPRILRRFPRRPHETRPSHIPLRAPGSVAPRRHDPRSLGFPGGITAGAGQPDPRGRAAPREDEELWDGRRRRRLHRLVLRPHRSLPCPAPGCTFVADFMTAAHLVLVWEERDDPNLLWHAQRAKEVGRNPRIVSYERGFGPSASYYAWEAAGRPVHGVRRR